MDTTLLSTPFVASWFARARPGDLFDPDPSRRASAWAHWVLTSLTPRTGHGERPYTAIDLPGRFYDPRRAPTGAVPHLEVSTATFGRPDPQFPDRLAQVGNGLHFPWWIVPEVLAVKRCVLNPNAGDAGALLDLLNDRRVGLMDALNPLNLAAARHWDAVEALQVDNPQVLSQAATAAFDTDEIADYLPAAADLAMRISFDRKLAESSAGRASRRIGVWSVTGLAPEPFSVGVLTPRLTRSSMFADALFAPSREAPAALLVRGLLLRRLLSQHLGTPVGQPVADAASSTAAAPRLRVVVARVGDKVPEASTPSAVHFLQNYPDADNAWAALTSWANAPAGPHASQHRATLAVTAEMFADAHRAALRAMRRAEDPRREDINTLLPLAWDHQNRVVRVTFARPPAESD